MVSNMELLEKPPEKLFYTIHQKALADLSTRSKATYTVGIHTARMKIRGEIKRTIIPPMSIYISKITECGVVSSDIDYRITYNGQTFPLGHVYGNSGYLCLGNIPVPKFVSEYDLMSPLETLFLYNDRNQNHGEPKLNIDSDKHLKILNWCVRHGVNIISEKHDYIAHDTVWDIGHQLLEQYTTEKAYELADELFKIIFTKG